jgi:hypothetical protein
MRKVEIFVYLEDLLYARAEFFRAAKTRVCGLLKILIAKK